jgi:hypothetical protein
VPCADFSPWLCDRIRAEDADAIADFVWSVARANPGLGGDPESFRRHWRDNAMRMVRAQLDRHLHAESPECWVELRAALVLILLHDSFGGFAMTGDARWYLAMVMVPYRFETTAIQEMADRANEFIRHMRKDTPYWREFPLFTAATLDPWAESRPSEADDLCQVLRELPLASRAHFFDFASLAGTNGSTGRTPLDQATSYGTRKRGIDAEESARLLLQSLLVVPCDDPRELLRRLSVKELTEFLARDGVTDVKGRRKDPLIDALLHRCPQSVATWAKDQHVARLSPTFSPGTDWARKQIERSVAFFQAWLGFGFDRPTT